MVTKAVRKTKFLFFSLRLKGGETLKYRYICEEKFNIVINDDKCNFSVSNQIYLLGQIWSK